MSARPALRLRGSGLTVLLLGVFAGRSPAQVSRASWCGDNALHVGRLVTVATATQDGAGAFERASIAGRFRTCNADTLVLDGYFMDDPRELHVPREAIRKLWVQVPSTRLGIILGGLIGAGAGFAVGMSKSNLCPPSPCRGRVAVGAVIGLATGAAMGWLIGSSFEHRKAVRLTL